MAQYVRKWKNSVISVASLFVLCFFNLFFTLIVYRIVFYSPEFKIRELALLLIWGFSVIKNVKLYRYCRMGWDNTSIFESRAEGLRILRIPHQSKGASSINFNEIAEVSVEMYRLAGLQDQFNWGYRVLARTPSDSIILIEDRIVEREEAEQLKNWIIGAKNG